MEWYHHGAGIYLGIIPAPDKNGRWRTAFNLFSHGNGLHRYRGRRELPEIGTFADHGILITGSVDLLRAIVRGEKVNRDIV
jgi:hypothetical protein